MDVLRASRGRRGSIRPWAARIAAGVELGVGDHRGAAPWRSRRTHRNARRNRRSVVSAADLHPRHCFRSGAPSSKTYDSRSPSRARYGLIHEFRDEHRPFCGTLSTRLSTNGRHPSSSGRCRRHPRGPARRRSVDLERVARPEPPARRRDALEADAPRRPIEPPVAAEHDACPSDALARRDHGRRVARRSRRRAIGEPVDDEPVLRPERPADRRAGPSVPRGSTWFPWSVPSPSGWNVHSPAPRRARGG